MNEEPAPRSVVKQGHHWWLRLLDGTWRGCFYCDPGTAEDTEWDWQGILADINGRPYEVSQP
jgi:hypothetical protein